MKYTLLAFILIISFLSCSKDDITTEKEKLEIETISGNVFIDGNPALQDFKINLLSYEYNQDSTEFTADTLSTTTTTEGMYIFDQVIPSPEELFITIDLIDGFEITLAQDESPDGDPHDLAGIGHTIGVVLESDESDSDNNYYLTTQCETKVSGYVYIIDANGNQSSSGPMDMTVVERDENDNPLPFLFQQVMTNVNGYYELTLNADHKFSIQPSIADYPFLITQLDELIPIDETPDDDDIINLSEGWLDVDVEVCEIDDQNNFYFHLTAIPNVISGNVFLDEDLDGDYDSGISNAKVSLYERDAIGNPIGEKIDHKFTDEEGFFKFSNIPNGAYVLVLKKNDIYIIDVAYDANMETGEPNNPVENYISVNITDNVSDHLNYFILQTNLECDVEFSIVPYWALCDTSIICELSEIPLIIVDENYSIVTKLSGTVESIEWTNLTTGATSSSDWLFWHQHDVYYVEMTLQNGCTYELYYTRDCPQDFVGQMSMTRKSVELDEHFDFQEDEVVWTFDTQESELTITYNITPPAAANTLEPGKYDYAILADSSIEITDNVGVTQNLGILGYDGSDLYIDGDITLDGSKRVFAK